MENGEIKLDSEQGKELGFTSDKFCENSYLWGTGNRIIISAIEAREKNKGYFKELVKSIIEKGFQVGIPTPLPQMEYIVKKWGWKQTFEYSEVFGEVELWIKRE